MYYQNGSLNKKNGFTVTSHGRHGARHHRPLDRLASQRKKLSKVRIPGPLCKKSTYCQWISLTVSVMRQCVHVMTSSWTLCIISPEKLIPFAPGNCTRTKQGGHHCYINVYVSIFWNVISCGELVHHRLPTSTWWYEIWYQLNAYTWGTWH